MGVISQAHARPLISIICDKGKLTDEGCEEALEWIADPDKRRITVYNFE